MANATRKCHVCGDRYPKWEGMPPFQAWCSPECGVELARTRQNRAQEKKKREARGRYRVEQKARREALRSPSEWKREVQKKFNAYVRWRDFDKPCISCGELHPTEWLKGGSWDCGHYLSVGSHPELRFNELNAHRQCKHCNTHKSGNQAKYRINLIERIGLDLVEWLEGPHKPLKATNDELRWLRDYYKQRAKEAKAYAESMA